MGTNLENKSVNLDEAGLDSGKDLARAARPMGPKESMSGILSWYMNSLSFLSSVASRLILPSHVWTEKKTVLSKPQPQNVISWLLLVRGKGKRAVG